MPTGIIYSKVRGVTFEDRQDIIRQSVRPGMRLEAIREPQNPHGSTAIGLWAGKEQIGHVASDLAAQLAPQMDSGNPIVVTVTELTGGGPGESIGVNIVIDTAPGDSAGRGRNVALSRKILFGVLAGLLVVCVAGALVGNFDLAAGVILISIVLAMAAGVVALRRR